MNLPPEIEKSRREIEKYAREYGLDFHDVVFESLDEAARLRWMPGKGSVPMDEYRAAWREAVRVFGRNQVSTAAQAGSGLDPDSPVAASTHRAPTAGELRMLLQPVVRFIDTGGPCVVGAEALVRWEHPELGLLSPAAFVPFARRSESSARVR